ncbi:hypothetical protein WJX81_007998 [Elliptochloris bilobata]|uniref:anthranilate synthase n=1 Tax=Elliptochloris bilobata TaxID=381761 RepID=A0AAW1S9S8_9CHLO
MLLPVAGQLHALGVDLEALLAVVRNSPAALAPGSELPAAIAWLHARGVGVAGMTALGAAAVLLGRAGLPPAHLPAVVEAFPQALWGGAAALGAPLAALEDAGMRRADMGSIIVSCPSLLGATGCRLVVAFLASSGLGRVDICAVLRAVPSALTLSLETRLLPLRDSLLRLGLPMAALGSVLGRQPQLLLCTVDEVDAQAAFLEGLGTARGVLGAMAATHPQLLAGGLRAQLAALRGAGVHPSALGHSLARHPQLLGFGPDNQEPEAFLASHGVGAGHLALLLAAHPSPLGPNGPDALLRLQPLHLGDGPGGDAAPDARSRLRLPVRLLRAAGVPWREIALLAEQLPKALADKARPALAGALRGLLDLGLAPADACRALRRSPWLLRLAPAALRAAGERLRALGVPAGAVARVVRAAPGVLAAPEGHLEAALVALQGLDLSAGEALGMAIRHPPLLLQAPATAAAAAAQLAAWGWSGAEAAGMLRRCPLLLTLRLARPRYATRLRFLQEEVRCDARAVLAAHPGLLVHSLAHHTGPRTAFLRDACGARLPPPAAYLTLSDAAFCAGPGACLVEQYAEYRTLWQRSTGRDWLRQTTAAAVASAPTYAGLRTAPEQPHKVEHVAADLAGDPEFERFREAAERGNMVPLDARLFSDQLTPVTAYRTLVAADEREAPSFLFESVVNGTQTSRFSFLGAQPALEVIARGHTVTVLDHTNQRRQVTEEADPLAVPARLSAAWRPAAEELEGLPPVFTGGWVGYCGYDTVRYVYSGKLPWEQAPEDGDGLPEMHLALYNEVVVFDQATKLAHCVTWVHLDQHADVEAAYRAGCTALRSLTARLSAPKPQLPNGRARLSLSSRPQPPRDSDTSREAFLKDVDTVKEHIQAGDVFQLVLSQRFRRRTFADPFEMYRALRVVNPSPYMIYLQARGSILVASSPEILCRVGEDRTVTNRPLAGTRRRGDTPEADEEAEASLLADGKERAEHVMLVDLGRNDVGKVAEAGSVRVEKLMEVERYSHVMHISSTVTGRLLPGLTSWDALRAALPAGTVSGAPKVRAMQIIDSLESSRRGPYGGGIGHVSFTGGMDMALALRTMVVPTATKDTLYDYSHASGSASARREWQVYLQAGAGIVADSVPEAEYDETVNKAAALGRAIDLAEQAFLDDDTCRGM